MTQPLLDDDYFVFTNVFRDQICKGYDHKRVAHHLIAQSMLQPGTGGSLTVQKRLPGAKNSQRVVHLTSAILVDEKSAADEHEVADEDLDDAALF